VRIHFVGKKVRDRLRRKAFQQLIVAAATPSAVPLRTSRKGPDFQERIPLGLEALDPF
jgi:hypothetical protein